MPRAKKGRGVDAGPDVRKLSAGCSKVRCQENRCCGRRDQRAAHGRTPRAAGRRHRAAGPYGRGTRRRRRERTRDTGFLGPAAARGAGRRAAAAGASAQTRAGMHYIKCIYTLEYRRYLNPCVSRAAGVSCCCIAWPGSRPPWRRRSALAVLGRRCRQHGDGDGDQCLRAEGRWSQYYMYAPGSRTSALLDECSLATA